MIGKKCKYMLNATNVFAKNIIFNALCKKKNNTHIHQETPTCPFVHQRLVNLQTGLRTLNTGMRYHMFILLPQ